LLLCRRKPVNRHSPCVSLECRFVSPSPWHVSTVHCSPCHSIVRSECVLTSCTICRPWTSWGLLHSCTAGGDVESALLALHVVTSAQGATHQTPATPTWQLSVFALHLRTCTSALAQHVCTPRSKTAPSATEHEPHHHRYTGAAAASAPALRMYTYQQHQTAAYITVEHCTPSDSNSTCAHAGAAPDSVYCSSNIDWS
jgi:hypothetical protein